MRLVKSVQSVLSTHPVLLEIEKTTVWSVHNTQDCLQVMCGSVDSVLSAQIVSLKIDKTALSIWSSPCHSRCNCLYILLCISAQMFAP